MISLAIMRNCMASILTHCPFNKTFHGNNMVVVCSTHDSTAARAVHNFHDTTSSMFEISESHAQ